MTDRKPIARQAPISPTTPETWSLSLNRYQRDNLLWLLNRVGYPWDNPHRVQDLGELGFSRTSPSLRGDGDWLGEIVIALGKVEKWKDGRPVVVCVIDENDRPNGRD